MGSSGQDAAAQFFVDAKDHAMEVLLDVPDTAHRHLRFRRPGTGVYGFDVVTWPGHLSISGDMGTYVFSRLRDMFEFFRGHVSLMYWAEKCVAESVTSPLRQYSPDLFRDAVLSAVADYAADRAMTDDVRARLDEDVQDEVLCAEHDGPHAAVAAAERFEFEDRRVFADFHECNLLELSYSFVWCCHAIAYAVQRYDARISELDTENTQEGRHDDRG